MNYPSLLAVACVLAGLLVLYLTLAARRLDRLHQTVVKSRRALELALHARAEYAREFAAEGGLDVAASILLTDAADACLREGINPIVDDGLDGLPLDVARGAASDRRTIESSMSRTLRLTVDELEEEDVSAEFKPLLDKRLTRTFHNSHVDQIRRVRRSFYVRLFFLAGRAPAPATVDIDDE